MDKGLTPPFTSTNRMTECLAFDPSLAFPDFLQLRSSPDISCPRGSYTIGTQGLRKRSPDLLRPKPVEKETTNVDHFGILQEVLSPILDPPLEYYKASVNTSPSSNNVRAGRLIVFSAHRLALLK